MRAIHRADTPYYCDTDSIICKALPEGGGVRIHPTDLGAWKIEATGDKIAVAVKSCIVSGEDGEVVKLASKGVRMSAGRD